MSGRRLMGGLVAFTFLFAIALWWFQTRAYYERVDGLTEIEIGGDPWPVSDYRSIDAATSPLKLRACFTPGWDFVAMDDGADMATPLEAPGWFDCFDAGEIADAIESGEAAVILAADNEPWGFSRWIVHLPDGRGVMWRQINACGEATFTGSRLPESCPPKPAD